MSYVTPIPASVDPYQHFTDAKDGKIVTMLDGLRYLARLVPHIELETLTANDHRNAAEVFDSIYCSFDAIDPAIMIEGCKRLVHSKNPPPEMIKTLAGIPAVIEIVSHLETLERYCSHAKASFDLQQKSRLAWVPTLTLKRF